MVASGFVVNYIFKANLSLALIDMSQSLQPTNITNVHLSGSEEFNWTISQKNNLIGAIAWGSLLIDIPSSILVNKIGPRKAFGYFIILACFSTILFPLACRIHYVPAYMLRILLGVGLGGSSVCFAPLGVNWLPSSSRCIFLSLLSTTAIGIAISVSLSGYLIYFFGWSSVFYVTGAMGFIWTVLWFSLIYDSPEKHPKISRADRMKIMGKIANEEDSINSERPEKVPWLKILTSAKIWAIIVAQIACEFSIFTFTTQLPMYFHDILHYDIQQNGVLSCLPFIGTWLTETYRVIQSIFVGNWLISIASCNIGCKLIKSKKLHKTTVRKLFQLIGMGFGCISLLLLTVLGQNTNFCIILLIISVSMFGCVFCDHIASIMDVAPNFSASVCGILAVVMALTEYSSTLIVTYFNRQGNTFDGWCNMFTFMSGICFFGCIFFMVFGSGVVEDWNYKVRDNQETRELTTQNC